MISVFWRIGVMAIRFLVFRVNCSRGFGKYVLPQSIFPIYGLHMGSLFGNIFGILRSYKRDPYVHPYRSLGKLNIDSSSCEL